MYKFKSQSTGKKVLGNGEHLVKIVSIAHATAKASEKYKDTTPQLEVKYENEHGVITCWYNLKGYKPAADGKGYAIDKKQCRIEDPIKTEAAQSIFGRVGLDAGIPEGADFSMEDLIGMEVGIMVHTNETGQKRVRYTIPADELTEATIDNSEEVED